MFTPDLCELATRSYSQKMWIISVSTLLGTLLMLCAGFKVDVWPRMWSLSTQTDVNRRKVSVLLNGHCGKAGGNCELRATSFILLCKSQCRMNEDVILLLCMLRSHMVSIPSGHSRALHAKYDHCECELRLAAKFRAGLFQSTAALTVTLI